MMKTKLLSTKKNNNVIIYSVLYDEEKLTKFLDQLDEKYTFKESPLVEATFSGLTPISYGKYDELRDRCIIKELGVLDTKKERLSDNYHTTIGASTREWDFLTEEEKNEFCPVEGTRKGKLKLDVTYPSEAVKIIKDTFLTDDKKCIIDGTQMIKLYNHILDRYNYFTFDKTIELDKKKKNWNDPSNAFFSIRDYHKYLSNLETTLNKDTIKLSSKEEKLLREDLGTIISELAKQFYIEQVGMFPMNLTLSEELEIIKRYAIRNEEFEWLNRSLDYSPVNYDGGQLIASLRNTICNNYDLDGKENEKKIISDIERKRDVIEYLTGKRDTEPVQEEPKKEEVLTKVIKAA